MGTDHGGFALKNYLKSALEARGWVIHDFGTYSEESVDYPDFIHPVAQKVNDGIIPVGIIFCGSGNGANIVANKYPKVRSALCWNVEVARLARWHNDANILALPGRMLEPAVALEIAETFLKTGFEGGRHIRRIEKIPIH